MAHREWLNEILKRQPPERFQGVTKERIRKTLRVIARESDDMVDAVFALLDNTTPTAFSRAGGGATFSDGASTAQVADHVGRFQRRASKLDREGRDYWIKPLRDVGAIEQVYLNPATGTFVAGHPVAKSPNSAYRLAASFVQILTAVESEWRALLDDWIRADHTRNRLSLQATLGQEAQTTVDTKHADLIRTCRDFYAPRFLRGYEVIYIDDGDGDRITATQRETLAAAGVELTLDDSMPDLLFWNRGSDSLWVVEAVTSDGEVDLHKFEQLTTLAGRARKQGIGFTTAYPTWSVAKARQAIHKNIAPSTYVWVMEDPSKHFLALDDQKDLLLVEPGGRQQP